MNNSETILMMSLSVAIALSAINSGGKTENDINPNELPRFSIEDERYQSHNIEMASTNGDFEASVSR